MTKDNELLNFEGIEVNYIIGEDNKPLFELYSVGMALGYTVNPKGTLYARKDRIDSVARNAEITGVFHDGKLYITEEEMYDFILEAHTEPCKRFKKWLTRDVLPSLRQDGGYMMTNENESDEDIMARALLIAQKTIERKDKMIEKQQEQLKLQEPKVEYHDKVLSDDGLLTTTVIAKSFGMSARRLNEILNRENVQYKQRGCWIPYAKYDGKGYCKIVHTDYGEQLLWTQKGKKFIWELLINNGYITDNTIDEGLYNDIMGL